MNRKTGKNRLKRRAAGPGPVTVARDSFQMTREEFRRIREALGISQTALGERLGIGYAAVCRKENGHVPIKRLEAETMRRLQAELKKAS